MYFGSRESIGPGKSDAGTLDVCVENGRRVRVIPSVEKGG